jgi:hypothetical protein
MTAIAESETEVITYPADISVFATVNANGTFAEAIVCVVCATYHA